MLFEYLHIHAHHQVLGVTCQVSHVTCDFFLFLFLCGQSCVASWWRVCYQRGLPHQVYLLNLFMCVSQSTKALFQLYILLFLFLGCRHKHYTSLDALHCTTLF